MVRVRVAYVAQNDVAIEVYFGESDAVIEDHRRRDRFRAIGDAGGESGGGVVDLDGDGADGEAVFG